MLRYIRLLMLVSLSGMVVETSAQVHLVVTGWPDEPESPEIYVAGSFNSWQPGDELFRMQRTADGFVLDIPVRGTHEFKFTRGGWDKVETDASGKDVGNRNLSGDGGTLECSIAGWADGFAKKPPVLNEAIIVHEMKAPFLATYKNIRICLPEGYADDTTHYPVIYMMDGQNLFDDATSYAGEWGVDEALQAHMAAGRSGAIIVGVDHSGPLRMMEYTPWANETYGGGLGEAFSQWLMDSVVSYMDAHYRTIPDRTERYVAGSSLGGLISTYLVLAHGDVFGGGAAYSPSYWFSDQLFDYAAEHTPMAPMRFEIYGGGMEDDDDMVPFMMVVYDLMNQEKDPGVRLRFVVESVGQHNESWWRKQWPGTLGWLLDKQ